MTTIDTQSGTPDTLALYLLSRLYFEIIFSLPIIAYAILLTYMIHLSRTMMISKRKLNKTVSTRKKQLIFSLICFFFYQSIYIIFVGSRYDIGDLFFLLLVQTFKIVASVLTLFLIKEQSKKRILLPYKNPVLFFLVVVDLILFHEIYLEFYYNLFFNVVTCSLIGTICSVYLSYLFYHFPTDDDLVTGTVNETYFELQQIFEVERSGHEWHKKPEAQSNYKRANLRFGSHKSLAPMSSKEGNNSYDDLCSNNPEMLPIYPKIEVFIKETFNVHFKEGDVDAGLRRKSSPDFWSGIHLYIMVRIRDRNIDKIIKRSLSEFMELDQLLHREFVTEKYQKSLVDQLPKIRTTPADKKGLLSHRCQGTDFIKDYKLNFEAFLKSIVHEPAFITKDVLNFLDIQDSQLSFSYNLARRKKKISAKVLKDDAYVIVSPKDEENIEQSIKESIINLKKDALIISNHSSTKEKDAGLVNIQRIDQFPPNSKLNIVNSRIENNELMLTLRMSSESSFKLIKKKFADIMKMINELGQINKTNENIKNLLKLQQSVEFFGEKSIHYFIFKKDSSSALTKTISLIENVVQNTMDNFKLYKSNNVINEFFTDFFDISDSLPKNTTEKNEEELGVAKVQSYANQLNDLIKKIEMLNSEQKIKNVIIDAYNYIYIAFDFKCRVFYEVKFQINLLSGERIELSKKYKFKELLNYIECLKLKLGVSSLNSLLKSESTTSTKPRTQDEKNSDQLKKTKASLNELCQNPIFILTKGWTDILYSDTSYTKIKTGKKRSGLRKQSTKSITRGDSMLLNLTNDSLL